MEAVLSKMSASHAQNNNRNKYSITTATVTETKTVCATATATIPIGILLWVLHKVFVYKHFTRQPPPPLESNKQKLNAKFTFANDSSNNVANKLISGRKTTTRITYIAAKKPYEKLATNSNNKVACTRWATIDWPKIVKSWGESKTNGENWERG